MSSARFISLKDIRRRPDAREINRENVEGIKASIQEVGLLSPVIVRHAAGSTFELIAGNHRFMAVQELGEPDILALDLADLDDLKAELAMIDENLRRADPSPAERSAQVARRKAIYEELHPEARHGGDRSEPNRKSCDLKSQSENSDVERFTVNTAAATGRSERAVQLDAERGEKVIPEALNMVRGTKLDTGAYLDKLKRLPPNDQVHAVKRDLVDRPPPREPQDASRSGGIAARYSSSTQPTTSTLERFIAHTDQIEAMTIDDLVRDAGRKRSTLTQRASGLIDRLTEILARADQ
ncbi:ParB N-terminal domain-containing protein [Aliihoeflea sp. PC F10.4]